MRIALSATALAVATSPAALAAPVYESDEAREVVEAMLDAHGGAEAWLEAPAITARFVMWLDSLPVTDERAHYNNWRSYTTQWEPATNRAWANLDAAMLNDVGDTAAHEADAGFDGENFWRGDFAFDDDFQDPTFFLTYFHMGMIALPALTQVDGAILSYQGRAELPYEGGDYDRVTLSYDGETADRTGSFDLYVDPETRLLKGWRHGTTIPALPGDDPIPSDVSDNGPRQTIRIIHRYQTVDGRTLAAAYSTIPPNGEVGGVHLVLDVDFDGPFREDLAQAPVDGD